MSLASLNFLFRADTENFQRKLRQSKKDVGSFASSISKLGPMVAGAFSVVEVINFAKASVQAFDESEKANAKLLTSLDGNQEAFRRLSDQATLLQSKSLFDDEAIKGAQMFLSSMKLNETQISRLMPLVMDFSTKTGMDIVQSANLMAKSIGSSTNALQRYGIQVEGAVGSSERFEMVISGLEKQVGGLSEAATEAGTSGIVQLQNAINDLQEVVGEVIGGPLNKFIGNLKDIIELRSGKSTANFATEIEQEGRKLVATAKTTEDARKALVDYITEKKNGLPYIGNMISQFDKEAKSHWANGKAMREDQAIAADYRVQYEGTSKAIKELTNLVGNEAAIKEILRQANEKIIVQSDAEITAAKRKAEALHKEALEAERLANAIKNISSQIEKEEAISSQAEFISGRLSKTFPEPTEKLKPSSSFGAMDQSVDMKPIDDYITKTGLAIELTDTLASSIASLGDQLAQGADSWAEYGELVVKSLKSAIAMIIKEGVAIAIKNALITSAELGPFAPAIAAIAGGLAAGVFSTALNTIPSFAEGGFIKSPQLIMAGDAKDGKGEWILNSSQMKNLTAQKQAPFVIKGELKARGRELVYVFNNESSFHGRTR